MSRETSPNKCKCTEIANNVIDQRKCVRFNAI